MWRLAGAPPDDVPGALADPCARTGRDVLRTAPVDRLPAGVGWMLGADGWGAESAFALGLGADGLLFASGVDVTLAPALLTVRVAEIVQDHLTGHEAIQWPGCPGHRHPLEPAVDAGEAWWRCRSTRRPVARIGELPALAPPEAGR